MSRKLQDPGNKELIDILNRLLESDIDISAREVARQHSSLSSASTITRHPTRRQLLADYQIQQSKLRDCGRRLRKRAKSEVTSKLVAQEAKIAELNLTVQTLVSGHMALIAAVAQLGGMSKLHKYYENFRDVRAHLTVIGAIPSEETQNVVNVDFPQKTTVN